MEFALLIVLSVLVVGTLAFGFLRRERVLFWNPLTMFAAVYLYYFILGPLVSILTGTTEVGKEDARSVYYLGWLAGVVGFGSTLAAFSLPLGGGGHGRSLLLTPSAGVIKKVSWICLGVGLASVLASLAGPSRGFGDSFGKYIFSLNNLLAIYFALSIWLYRGQPMGMLARVSVPFGLLMVLLVVIGFRGPIFGVVIAIVSYWYLIDRSRPSLLLTVAAGLGAVVFAGVMVLSRSYFSGVDLSRLEGLGLSEVLAGGMGDSVTFGALCLVVDRIPSVYPFHYMEPIWTALTFPIPRALWPDKPVAEYLATIQLCVDPSGSSLEGGMAVPNIGEYYLAFGWPGIAVGSFMLGILCRGMWGWYRRNSLNPLVIATYGAFFSWLFQTLHRGYLPHALMTFAFGVMPGIVLAVVFSRAGTRGFREVGQPRADDRGR